MTIGEPWSDRSDDQVDWDQIVRVLDDLPPSNHLGTWRDTGKFSRDQWRESESRHEAVVYDWMRACYDEAVLVDFDWNDWVQDGAGKMFIDYSYAVRGVDLETLRKVVTAHLRADRFVEGHLLAWVHVA